MSFISAGEILGTMTPVRTLTIAHFPELPDGDYAMVEAYCTDPGCDCRKTMIFVHLDRRHVSTINFGWESPKFYARWYGAPLDARTLAEMKGPCIDLNSPNLVPPGAMPAFFSKLLDAHYIEHLRLQYTRFRAALAKPAAAKRLAQSLGGGGDPPRNSPCPAAAVESSRSAAAGAGHLAPPRRQRLDPHGDLPLLDAFVAAFRAADADEDEDDGTALGLGAAEHAQLGADRIGEHRPGNEAPLVKVGTGAIRSPNGLKKL